MKEINLKSETQIENQIEAQLEIKTQLKIDLGLSVFLTQKDSRVFFYCQWQYDWSEKKCRGD